MSLFFRDEDFVNLLTRAHDNYISHQNFISWDFKFLIATNYAGSFSAQAH